MCLWEYSEHSSWPWVVRIAEKITFCDAARGVVTVRVQNIGRDIFFQTFRVPELHNMIFTPRGDETSKRMPIDRGDITAMALELLLNPRLVEIPDFQGLIIRAAHKFLISRRDGDLPDSFIVPIGILIDLICSETNIYLFGQVRLVFCVQTSFEILDQATLIPAQQKVTSMVIF
jgi:hypothetical protein